MRLNQRLFIILALLVLAAGLRLPYAGSVMSADERNWMLRSQTFWHELFRDKDISGTFLSSHPGATVMWLAGAGITWQEKQLGFDLNKSNTIHFRRYATAPIALTAAFLIAAAAALVMRLYGPRAAILSGVLLAVDPYLVGMHQVVHPDALLGLFMLIALLGALVWLKEHHRKWLFVVGIVGGLAFVTKLLPALWLVPIVGLILLWPLKVDRTAWRRVATNIILVAVLAAVTFAVVWPATVAQPDFQLGYLTRDATTVATQEHVALEASPEAIDPISFYLRTWLGRLTLLTHSLVIGLIGFTAYRWYRVRRLELPPSLRWLLFYGTSYLIFITFAAKKADRYAVPALIVFTLLAGLALTRLLTYLERRYHWQQQHLQGVVALVVVLVALVPLSWGQYTIAYNNPLWPSVRPPSQQGWGEGLEAATAWINDQPGVDQNTIIAAWYSSVVSTYSTGKVVQLNSRFSHEPEYIVTYRNMSGRAPDTTASEVLRELEGDTPLYTVLIKGVPYAWVWTGDSVQP